MAEIVFGTSGWRAVIGDDFVVENVRLVAAAIGKYLVSRGESSVIVGYDTRFMGKRFAEAGARVLAGQGLDVHISNRPVPTPAISFGVLNRRTGGALNFTASHNPPEYNGIKFSPSWGGPALPETTREIERLIKEIERITPASFLGPEGALREGLMSWEDLREPYLSALREKVDSAALKRSRLAAVLDHMHGTSVGYLDAFLMGLGCVYRRLHLTPDPYFGGGRPDPSRENLSKLMGLLRRNKSAALGLATDGDADRFGVVDRGGHYVEANLALALLLQYLVKTRRFKGGVARSVSTTHLLDAVADLHGLELFETPVGFKYIGELLVAGKIDMGCEESAGFTMKGHVPEKDGILACLLIAEMVAREGKSLHQLRDRLFREVGPLVTRREDIPLTAGQLEGLRKSLLSPPDRLGGRRVTEVKRLDGTKLYLDGDAWLLVRESGTEPLVRLYGEARTEGDLERLMEEGRALVTGQGVG